jgi:hypothetical protein
MSSLRSRLLTIVFATAAAVVVLAIAGCGGSTGLARQYAQNGDALFKVARGIGVQLGAAKAQVQRLMVSNDLAGLLAIEPQVQGLLNKMDSSTATVEKALAQYRKVISLKGVDDYKQYAIIQSEAALKEQQAIAVGKQLANLLLGALETARAGRPVNLTDSLRTVNSSINSVDELERQIDSLMRDARDFAADMRLF